MSDYPSRVSISEEGPREGFQFEKGFIPTERKLQLIDALSETGVAQIEVTSFVSPKWVPQTVDADEITSRFKVVPGVTYRALYLNQRGLERAAESGKYQLRGRLSLGASPTFIKKNTNKTLEETVASFDGWITKYEQMGIPVEEARVNAAFGCNYHGEIPPEWIVDRVTTIEKAMKERGHQMKKIGVSDTMGWANPRQVRVVVDKLRERWPDKKISFHFHDTRGPGLANVLAAMEMGVSEFDGSVGGLGGCPFAGHAAAAGNVCTEDMVFMCHEMGIETGVDLEKLIECARLAEEVVGHPLPGRVMRAGSLAKYRSA